MTMIPMPAGRKDDGFTIQELLVSLVVSALVISFAFTAFLFVKKTFQQWKAKTDVERVVARSGRLIMLDFAEARHVTALGDSSLVFQKHSGVTVQYSNQRGVIRRNGDPLTSPEIPCVLVATMTDAGENTFDGDLRLSVRGSSGGSFYRWTTAVLLPRSSREQFISALKKEGIQ